MEITLGVVGCGRIAQAAHLPAIEKADGVRLVAVSDSSHLLATEVGRQFGVPSYTDASRLLELDLDAVLIATPDRFHLPLGLQALAAGKHVLVEKPLASTAAEARELMDAAAAAGKKLQTGSMKRHDPGLQFARAHLPSIGSILSMNSWYRVMAKARPGIQATLLPPMIEDESVRGVESTFKEDKERYRLATHGAHLFDGLRYFAGDVDWLSARSASIAGDTTWHGSVGIARGGGLASFEITTSVHSQWAEGVDIYGEFGHIRTRSPYAFLKCGSSAEVFIEGDGVSLVPHFSDTNPFKRQIEAFARAIMDGSETDPAPLDGVRAVELIEAAALSSSADGRKVWLR